MRYLNWILKKLYNNAKKEDNIKVMKNNYIFYPELEFLIRKVK